MASEGVINASHKKDRSRKMLVEFQGLTVSFSERFYLAGSLDCL